MKLLIVTERYWPEVGAAPSRLANMAEGLIENGCEVDVLTSLPNYPKGRIYGGYRRCVSKKEEHNGAALFRYWIYATVSTNPLARILNMFSFAVTLWLFSFHRKRISQYDAVIIQTPTLVVAYSAMMLFKVSYGKKCFLNVSDIWPLTAVDMGVMEEGSGSFRFMQRLEHYLYKKCDGILGQSEEILNHVAQERIILGVSNVPEFRGNKDSDEVLNSKLWECDEKLFLYRNLLPGQPYCDMRSKGKVLKIVFSGMLGVAQNVAGIAKNVSFKELGVEFHILGDGKQLNDIQQWCMRNPCGNVFLHGYVPKEQNAERLNAYDISIVPLASRIRGAVPSKLYDILPHGLPIIFCGDGEGAYFIEKRNIGLINAPGDYAALTENIRKMRDLSMKEYSEMSARCIKVCKEELDFDKQMVEVLCWMKTRIFSSNKNA